MLGWRSGSDVEQLLIWLPKCTKILMCLELPNTMFIVSASFCGHCYRERNRSNMVLIFCICSKQFQQITMLYGHKALQEAQLSPRDRAMRRVS